ncbi:unnamed protein product [Caenorhabditis nigoni]
MWLIKVPLFLLLIGGTKSKKDSQFVLEEYYQEASRIYEKANKIHLEYELATGKVGALDVAERILDKKMDASVLEEYVEMNISEGLKEQNEMLKLFEKAEEVKTSDQSKDDVEDAFTLMDGFDYLDKKIPELHIDGIEDYIQRLHKRKKMNPDVSSMKYLLGRLHGTYSAIFESISNRFKDVSEYSWLTGKDKSAYWENVNMLPEIIEASQKMQHLLKASLHFDIDLQVPFKRPEYVTKTLNAMMREVKNLEGLAPEIPKIEKEMEVLEELKNGNVIEEIKNRFQNLTKSSDFLKDFRTTTSFDGEYRGIQSIYPLLQKIKSFSSKMRAFEFRTSRTSKEWSTFENHFQQEIQPGSLTEKFSNFQNCIQNFDFQMSFPMDFFADFDKKLARIRSVDLKMQKYKKSLEELEKTTKNLYAERAGRDTFTLFREFLNEYTWLQDFKDVFIVSLSELRDSLNAMDLDNVRKIFVTNVKTARTFLECYSLLNVTAPDMKDLMVLPGKVWNFDPKVLEGTVEMIGMFKEAYKMMEEIKEWKVASNPEIENFPLDGEDVKAVADGINVLETIGNVQNGWEMMKTLDLDNSLIKDSWDILDSSFSQFFEILSNQKIWSVSNVSFPTNLPIDTIRTFIEDVYQEDRRNYILNFLKEIQKLETDFPEYPNKLEKMNEAMGKIKEWEDGKMNPVKKMVDCFEMECNATLELPEASN